MQTKKEKLQKYFSRLQVTRTGIVNSSVDRVKYGSIDMPKQEALRRVDLRISEAECGMGKLCHATINS